MFCLMSTCWLLLMGSAAPALLQISSIAAHWSYPGEMYFGLHAGQQSSTPCHCNVAPCLQVAASTVPPSTSFMDSQSVQGPLSSSKCRLKLIRLNLLFWQHCHPLKPLQLSETTSHMLVLIVKVD